MLIFDDVFVRRAGRGLFRPVSFALQPGEIMTLQGESGLGKSTLLHALIDQEPGVEFMGEVTLDGHRMDADARLSTESQTVFPRAITLSTFIHWRKYRTIHASMCRNRSRGPCGSVIRSAGSSRDGYTGSVSIVSRSNDARGCRPRFGTTSSCTPA